MFGVWWIDLLSFVAILTPVIFTILGILIYHKYDVYKTRRIKWRRITDSIRIHS